MTRMAGTGLRAMLARLRGDGQPVHLRHSHLVTQTRCGLFLTKHDRWTRSRAEVTCKQC